jgi:hypothetical protein
LLLSWEKDDLGVDSEIAELGKVFSKMYKFQVERYYIPNLKPDRALKRRMIEFLEYESKDTLFIVYYAGHARRGLQSNEGSLWFP